MENKTEVSKLTATQRIEKLENDIESIKTISIQALDSMKTFLLKLNELRDNTFRQFNIVNQSLNGADSDFIALTRILSKSMPDLEKEIAEEKKSINEEQLKYSVELLVKSNLLEASDLSDEGSFIVFREVMDDGSISVRRSQFSYSDLSKSLGEDMSKMFLSRQVGEVFKVSEDANRSIEILEIYKILAQTEGDQ